MQQILSGSWASYDDVWEAAINSRNVQAVNGRKPVGIERDGVRARLLFERPDDRDPWCIIRDVPEWIYDPDCY